MLATLPANVRRQARSAYRLFAENPNHPGLQFKKVHDTKPIYSVRISENYRAVGEFNGNDFFWFWIGPHREYDKLLGQL